MKARDRKKKQTSASAPQLTPDGSFEFGIIDLPPPGQYFVADAVHVFPVPSLGSINLYFVGADPELTVIRNLVRVRFATVAMLDNLINNPQYSDLLDKHCAERKLPTPWRPTLDDVRKFSADRSLSVEGSFVLAAHFGDAAMADVYLMPSDFVVKTTKGTAVTPVAVLRVTLPTVVLRQMIVDLRSAVPALGLQVST